MSGKNKLILVAIAAMFATGAYLYAGMPDVMASHWDSAGEPNGYMPKFWVLFLLPGITLAVFLLLLVLPKIDPLKANYAKFQNHYNDFLAVFAIFMTYVYVLTIAFNRGVEFNMTAAIIPAMAMLFWFTGAMLEKAGQNWFIGIRTPWTLSSGKVWDKTNKLGAKIFKIFAIASLAGLFFGGGYFLWLVVSLVAASLYLVVYSYLEFHKQK
jgi:uncharacterized membrane protein